MTTTPDTHHQPLQLQATGRRREYEARLVSAGRTRGAGGRPGYLFLEAAALEDATTRGLFAGRPMFLDHPQGHNPPQLRNIAAITLAAAWNPADQAADATIRLYDTPAGRLVDQLLADILADQANGVPLPDVGLSMVFWPEPLAAGPDGSDARHVTAIRHVESFDFVFEPAADGRIKRALSALQGDPMPDETPTTATATTNPPTTPDPQPDPWQQHLLGQTTPWVSAVQDQAMQLILSQSHLPEPVRARLARGHYESPEQLATAIQEARDEVAAINQHAVIQIGGHAPRGASVQIGNPMDEAANAVDWLFGVQGARTPDPVLRKADILYVALTGDREFHGVFDPHRVMFASATTTTLANMAVNAMNKVIMAQFSHLTHWRWYEHITHVAPNDGSLQTMQWITYGGISNLPTVAEGAAYTELTVDDVRETDAFVKKGGYVGITREMIRNSDIQRIQAVPRALAIAAVRTRSAAIAAIFTDNAGVGPTLDQDATALFHANHNNVLTTAFGTDATAWRAARTECFKHTEVHSAKRLGVYPKYALLPPDLYDVALSVFGYGEGMPTTFTPEAQDRGFADPRPIPLIVPDWTDLNDWAYIVDPAVYPIVQMSFSQAPGGGSHPAPELFSVVSETAGLVFTNDTLPIKVRDEFAAGVNGPRGIGKRNVA